MEQTLKQLLLRIGLRLLLIIAVLLFLVLLLPPLLNLFLPFVLAFLAASILAPLVRKMAKKSGTIRNFWSMLFVVLLILAATGILIYAGYYLVSQIADLIGSWNAIQTGVTDTINGLSSFLENEVHLPSPELEDYLVDILQSVLDWARERVASWAPSVVVGVGNFTSGLASFVISLLFFIVGTYFMTADYPTLREKLVGWIPDIIHPHMRHLKDAMGSAMFGYLRAQLILSGAVALIIFLAMLIYGQPYSILIALACGVIDIIPFFGSGAVLVPWAIIQLVFGNYKKALFLLVLALILFLFRKLAEPKVVGDQTGLSPLLSLISIYVGMKLGGVLGMILCPILCMIVIGLYGMGFFDPTISDFKLLISRILAAARISPPEDTTSSNTESE